MSYRRRQTYSVGGPLKISGVGPVVALAFLAVNLAFVAWGIYFLIKIASFVNAWPF